LSGKIVLNNSTGSNQTSLETTVYNTNTGSNISSCLSINASLVSIPYYSSFTYLWGSNFTGSNLSYLTYWNLDNNHGQVFSSSNNMIPVPDSRFGLVVAGRIACGNEIDTVSDIRIKKNINSIDTHFALDTVRKLQPKTYEYIHNNKPSKLNYGFIAQEVDTVFSDSINKQYDYTTNLYGVGILKGNSITLLHKKTSDIILDDTSSKKINIKIFLNGKEQIVTLKEIVDERTFLIYETITEKITDNDENLITIYGQGVDDFHLLEKNAIFTLTTASVQQLDKELQETKEIVKSQQQEINELKNELIALKLLIHSKLGV
jgi:uncharacterized protein YdcH (DUF465 family)